MARYIPGNDATAARRIAREQTTPPGTRADETPRLSHLDRLAQKPGSDPSQAIADLYATGRKVYGTNLDARRDARTPEYRPPSPSGGERASYGLGKPPPMEPAPSEYGPQFLVDKKSDRVDTKEAWCRGMAKEQHPFFDKGGSGSRYSGRK